jgi:predicted ATPase/class 3 adenylate cyclase
LNNIPSGNVTFLFTDIEGSTKLAQKNSVSYIPGLDKHDKILSEVIQSNKGFVFKTVGDAFCCAFENSNDAVRAALDAQIELSSQEWKDAEIKVRMGIHSGKAEWSGSDYMGYLTLARSSRVMSAAYGNQILISNDVYENIKDNLDFYNEKKISFRDFGERRLKDLIQPMRIFQIVSEKLQSDFPPIKTLDARPNNIPVQLTSFIGRDIEIPEIKSSLEKSRLVTLVGPGGTGKTRLSIQVGADQIDDFPDGVFLIELAPVSDPEWIPETVLNSLKIKEEQGKSTTETLTDFLKDKEMLLLFDNCEHLINESANLCELLLRKCHKLKIISTSREALNCPGEQIYRVPALSYPDPAMQETAETLTQYASVRLFIERALSVNPGFRVNNNNAPALAEICSRLDGIPLAIELAAARIKAMSVEKINERLDNSFKLLTGGVRTALPRQQTLKALIDWSYDLLSENEKLLLARLSVFNGSWSLEAAERICSDGKISDTEILDLMSQLAEKSVIIYDEINERYKMLETIRQYGNEKLEASGESENLTKNHFHFFKEFALNNLKDITGNNQLESFKLIETDINNIDKALSEFQNLHDKEEGVRLAVALDTFWDIKGDFSSMVKWNEISLKYIDQIPDSLKASILYTAGMINKNNGKYNTAERLHEESLMLRLAIKDKSRISNSLWAIGEIESIKGNFMKARAYFERCLEIRKEIKHKTGITSVINSLSNISLYLNEYERARSLMLENLELLRVNNEKRPIALTLYNLAIVEHHLAGNQPDDYIKANEYLEESLLIFRQLGNSMNIAYCYILYGLIEVNLKNLEKARTLMNDGLSLMRKANYKYGVGNALFNLGNIELKLGNLEKAKSFIGESLMIKIEFHDKRTIAGCFSKLSHIAELLSDYKKSLLLFCSSKKIKEDLGITETEESILENKEIHSRLKSKLGDDEFSILIEKGRSLTMEQAVEIALSE